MDVPWHCTAEAVLDALDVDPDRGLTKQAARERLVRFGHNELRGAATRSDWRIFVDQFLSLMVGLLAAAAALAFVLVDWIDAAAIGCVIVINVVIGFFTERKAVRSMEALYQLGQVTALVRRDGQAAQIAARDLVPGDIVLVEGGDVVAADMRLVDASRIEANESALTGESAPVAKSPAPIAARVELVERSNMLYKGTSVMTGSGAAVVVATGLGTELGHITALVEETEAQSTPLERRLERLGRALIIATLALATAICVIGLLAGRDMTLMIETAIALAVATVPEGLPVVATIALARGMWRMARHNVLIRSLSSVETLGATGIICTDKTGTLTENRMTAVRLTLPSTAVHLSNDSSWSPAPVIREALEIGVLCNNAELSESTSVGDPMEIALLRAGERAGLSRRTLLEREPEHSEEAFHPETKMMATRHHSKGKLRIAVKGAPEAVVAACSRIRDGESDAVFGASEKERWLERNEALAAEGLRVLGLATRRSEAPGDDPYHDLTFVGLIGLVDPPRIDVKQAISDCRNAGIEIVMATGDQAATALYIARAVGIVEDGSSTAQGSELASVDRLSEADRQRLRAVRVFARVSPKQKLDLIDLHQRAGSVVAMTGDGVNDAPALKKADIGVAMGLRGTQVAREAAAMVLKDDAFPSIVIAIEQGRIIFSNIRKFVIYLLSCNVSEVLIVALATAATLPLPLLPLQILYLNLLTDVFPALALGVGPGDRNVMKASPRPASQQIITRDDWIELLGHGLVMTAAVLASFWMALSMLAVPPQAAGTIAFLTLALAQLWHVFNMRDVGSRLIDNDIVRNPWAWGALILCLALLAAAVFEPVLAQVLSIVVPDARGWILILAASVGPLMAGQLRLAMKRER